MDTGRVAGCFPVAARALRERPKDATRFIPRPLRTYQRILSVKRGNTFVVNNSSVRIAAFCGTSSL
jgi:hypothetical protein